MNEDSKGLMYDVTKEAMRFWEISHLAPLNVSFASARLRFSTATQLQQSIKETLMKKTTALIATLLMTTGASAIAAQPAAAKNPLSVHVLNLQTGQPTAGIEVELDQKQQDNWVKLASGVTDNNGRISALFPQDKTASAGSYRVVFSKPVIFIRRAARKPSSRRSRWSSTWKPAVSTTISRYC